MENTIEQLEITPEELQEITGTDLAALSQFNPIDRTGTKLLGLGAISALIGFSSRITLETFTHHSWLTIVLFSLTLAAPTGIGYYLLQRSYHPNEPYQWRKRLYAAAAFLASLSLGGVVLVPDLLSSASSSLTAGSLLLYSLLAITPFAAGTILRSLLITRQKYQYHSLVSLKAEVAKYNKIVQNIRTLEQLRAAGNPIKIDDRDKVLSAIQTMRNDLVRALKTERILRDNPEFRPEQFNIELGSLTALQVSDRASEYGRILSEALTIGTNVHEQMVKLSGYPE